MGSGPEAAFILGMRNAFAVSVALCAVAAGFSLVRGPEARRLAPAESASKA
jgi:hypothetical protein